MEQHCEGMDPGDLLAEARESFRRFEAEMEYPEGLIHLSEALSQLVDIAANTLSTALRQTCEAMVSTYARRVQARVQPLLTQSPVHEAILAHWWTVFSEFERSGFALPSQVTECSVDLLFKRDFGETLAEMSPSRRQEISKLTCRTPSVHYEDLRCSQR